MKNLLLVLVFLLLLSFANAQTKILDRSVNYDLATPTLTLYLSDSLVTHVVLIAGDSFGSSNLINMSTNINPSSIADNMLILSLSSLGPGDHFFEVAITSQNESTQVMQFQTHQ